MAGGVAYDVVILGGGVAGCATALALARRHGISNVLVVESRRYQGPRIGESIPPDSRALLEALGVWADFLGEGHEPCLGSCSSWGSDPLGYNDFLFNPHGSGWHLDRHRFDAFMARQAAASGARFFDGSYLRVAERAENSGFRLDLAGNDGRPQTVSARLVVDATGKACRFARQQGAKRQWVDQLLFVVAFCRLPAALEFPQMTLLEAVEYGWWYGARLPDRRLVLSIAADPAIVRRRGLRDPGVWLEHLAATRHLSAAAGSVEIDGHGLLTTVAPSFLLDKPSGAGWLAVGDAASGYDPISSQGIYKALSNALIAADTLSACLQGRGRLSEYDAVIAAGFQDYLQNRNYFYQMETRWPDAPFWRTRCARVGW